jgi:hypothetical protein
MKIAVSKIGLTAPGLTDWNQAQGVLCGHAPYRETELTLAKPARLPANERRRTTPLVRLTFQAAEQAAEDCPVPPTELAMVFGSSGGDTHVIHRICTALLAPERTVSPTQFHNSVHNAAAGYWSIATGAVGPCTTMSVYDDTVGAALLEAAALIHEENKSVLCVVCDQKPPPPLLAKRPLTAPFAAALLLRPPAGQPDCITLEIRPGEGAETSLSDPGLEALRLGNPAARILPVLQALARGDTAEVLLPAPGAPVSVRPLPA